MIFSPGKILLNKITGITGSRDMKHNSKLHSSLNVKSQKLCRTAFHSTANRLSSPPTLRVALISSASCQLGWSFLGPHQTRLSAASKANNYPYLLKYVPLQLPGHYLHLDFLPHHWFLFLCQTLQQAEWPRPSASPSNCLTSDHINTHDFTCHFHICDFHNSISCMDLFPKHQKCIPYYLTCPQTKFLISSIPVTLFQEMTSHPTQMIRQET